VHSLPDGYDTVLDAEASNLSAGEKQLVTIARAFLSDPAAHPRRGHVVGRHPHRVARPAGHGGRCARTAPSFVIAHRLSTIRDADVILVMEAGRIVEQGTHDELLAQFSAAAVGAYARLYAAQFSGLRRGRRRAATSARSAGGPRERPERDAGSR
jgi:ATP-binding cassette subfamily B multidrug efflux pump